MTRNRTLAAVASALVLGAGGAAGVGALSDRGGSDEPFQVVRAEASFAFDLEDQRRVAGFADIVIVGTVREVVGTERDGTPLPETRFRVQVEQALKGDLAGSIVINQQGGLQEGGRRLVLLEGDPMLEVGRSYLMFAKRAPDGTSFTIVPSFGRNDFTNRSPALRQQAIDAATEAVETEVVP